LIGQICPKKLQGRTWADGQRLRDSLVSFYMRDLVMQQALQTNAQAPFLLAYKRNGSDGQDI
jgi:hypothetical protein